MKQVITPPLFFEKIRFETLSKISWTKFEQLFGEKGACGNCWCMYPRTKRDDFINGKLQNRNKEALKEIVWKGEPAGMIALYENETIAWCAFAPREHFIKLATSRIHKPIDDLKVWSIPCLFIKKKYRRMGVSVALLNGVTAYASKNSIPVIEAYPTITSKPLPDAFAWVGLYSSFKRAGFVVVDHKSKNRPMMRLYTHNR